MWTWHIFFSVRRGGNTVIAGTIWSCCLCSCYLKPIPVFQFCSSQVSGVPRGPGTPLHSRSSLELVWELLPWRRKAWLLCWGNSRRHQGELWLCRRRGRACDPRRGTRPGGCFWHAHRCSMSWPGWGCCSIICKSVHLYLCTFLCVCYFKVQFSFTSIARLRFSKIGSWERNHPPVFPSLYWMTDVFVQPFLLLEPWFLWFYHSWGRNSDIQVHLPSHSYFCGQGNKNFDKETFLIQNFI